MPSSQTVPCGRGDGTGTAKSEAAQLFTETLLPRSVPTRIGCPVSALNFHSLALKSDGTLWAWGYNDFGQFGDGTTTESEGPIQIGTDTTWVTISAGCWYSHAAKSDGTIWA